MYPLFAKYPVIILLNDLNINIILQSQHFKFKWKVK
jgi:hypothetical protein